MKTELIQRLIPEALQEKFLEYSRISTEEERNAFRARLENLSEREQAEFSLAWLEGMQRLKTEVQALREEVARKQPAA